MTSPEFLSFIRTVTGDGSIGWISANATLYKPLDFLTVHDDGLTERKIAYVLNMTPEGSRIGAARCNSMTTMITSRKAIFRHSTA